MFLQILAVSCLAVFANAQIDVQSCSTYTAAVDKCKNDYPIVGGQPLTLGSVAGFFSLPMNVYCNATNKANFADQAECIQKAYIACAKNDFQKFVASADGIDDGVEYFCENYEAFDINCLSEIGQCITDKAPVNQTMPAISEGFDKNKEYFCGQTKYSAECLESNTKLKNCGKTKTKEIYMKIAEELKPPACDATSFVISSVLLLVSFFITL